MGRRFNNPWSKDNSPWFNEEMDRWNSDYNNDYNSSNSIRKVKITITNNEIGTGLVRSYPNSNGKKYIVPLYETIIKGKTENGIEKQENFSAIRFGVQYDKNRSIGPKVVGLKDAQSYILNWVDYMGGSWQVKGNWLIHKGADYPSSQAWGAIGCIEITGVGEWERFNNVIRSLSGENNLTKISETKTLSVYYEKVANRPLLKEQP